MRKRLLSSYLSPAVAALAIVLAACSSRLDTRGNLPNPELLSEIKPGQHNREQVERILGSPSSIAVFGQETWLYVSKMTETLAFFAPKVSERKVVVLRFDSKGVVADISTLGREHGQLIQPVERETPTAGNEIGFFDQIIGNMSRYKHRNAEDEGSTSKSTTPSPY
jgi:outer membrane protein assembly factor BamE (lipoprotein component of BamABCDE complex)